MNWLVFWVNLILLASVIGSIGRIRQLQKLKKRLNDARQTTLTDMKSVEHLDSLAKELQLKSTMLSFSRRS